jgi:hypothetical protein
VRLERSMGGAASWDTRVDECLARRFAAAPRARSYYLDLWADHQAAGLAGAHFVSEVTGPSDEKFWQRVWEMALGRHLRACGHTISTRPEGEPDYFFEVGGQGLWIEAISPSPGPDLPRHWTTFDPLDPGPTCGPVPNTEMLLRWTAAFKEKARKCTEYRRKGVVKPTEAFVIAIDGSQLSKFPHTHGMSRLPFAVESVFAIGPLAISMDPETRKLGSAFQTVQTSVENRNKAAVPKERFFRGEFSGVSAVLGCYAASGCHSPGGDGTLPVQVAYNPLALRPIAPGQLGTEAEEWTADLVSEDDEGIEWSVKRLPDP